MGATEKNDYKEVAQYDFHRDRGFTHATLSIHYGIVFLPKVNN